MKFSFFCNYTKLALLAELEFLCFSLNFVLGIYLGIDISVLLIHSK